MMRLIDKDSIADVKFQHKDNAYKKGWNEAIEAIIECEPTVDAVDRELYEQCKFDKDIAEEQLKKIVRCKDCVFGRTGEGVGVGKWNIDCLNPNISKFRLPTDYCSYGERKEE